MQPVISWQELEPHFNALVRAMDEEDSVDLESYDLLCNNLSVIPNDRIRHYRERVMERLLSLQGCEIENPYNLHPGDHLEEYIIGIPRVNNAKIGDYCLVGANTLITEGKEFPDNSLIVGFPGKVKRELTDIEKKMIELSALHYVDNMKRFKSQLEENTKKYE